jgi:hypothetical protein
MSTEPPSEFIRGPKWRTRTSPRRRHGVAALTFAVVVAVGLAVTLGCMWLLSWTDAPGWVVTMPWWLPTLGTLVWTLTRPTVSGLTDDDDDSWLGYSIRWVLVGELDARSAPVRVIAAILFGAPVVWVLVISGLLTLTGFL